MTTKAPPEDYLRQERELNALRQIAASLTFDQPMRGTLDRMAETIAEITDAPAVSICVVDGQHLKVAGTSRLPPNWELVFDRIWTSGMLPSPFEVISARKTVVFQNARRDMLVMPEYEPIQEALQSQPWDIAACMPLLYRGEALGFLGICLSAGAELDPAELRLYETIAGQVAVAVENARLFEEARRRREEAETLAAVAAGAAFDQPISDVLNALAERVVSSTPAVACTVTEYDREGQGSFAGSYGVPDGYIEAMAASWKEGPPTPALAMIQKNRQPLVVTDAKRFFLDNPRYKPMHKLARKLPWTSFISSPIVYHDRVEAVLTTYYAGAVDSESELPLLRALANQAAVVLENARLFEETRRRTRQAETLAQIAATLTVDQELDDTLQSLAEQLVAATNATGSTASVVVSGDGQSPTLRMAGSTGLGPGVSEAMNEVWASSSATVGFEALRNRKPVVLAEGRKALLANPVYAPARHIMRRQTWEAAVWLPLYYHDNPVGLVTAHYPAADDINDDEIAFLQAIADQAAIAVEAARLFGEASGRAALEERQRLARELHDSVSQALYGIALGARTARTQIERAPEKAIEPVDYVLSLAEAGLAEMRSLIFELRPESLETEGLRAALDKQVEAIRARHHIEVDADLCEEPDVPLATKEALYRIAQEALHNIVKHSRATQVTLRLACADDGLRLTVADNGKGFDPEGDFPGHLGLKSMRERAGRAGGTLAVDSSESGTSLTALLPIVKSRA